MTNIILGLVFFLKVRGNEQLLTFLEELQERFFEKLMGLENDLESFVRENLNMHQEGNFDLSALQEYFGRSEYFHS